MKPRHLAVTSIVLFGSLWGLSELGIDGLQLAESVPRAPLLAAAAIVFLVIARRVWDAPGTSFSLAVLASAFKFVQNPFFGCKIAAVLILGGAFDVAVSVARGREPAALWAMRGPWTYGRAVLATFASFVVFGFFARYVLQNPFWVAGGATRMVEYQLLHGGVAAALAVPATHFALRAGARVIDTAESWSGARSLAYRVAAATAGAIGLAAALATRG